MSYGGRSPLEVLNSIKSKQRNDDEEAWYQSGPRRYMNSGADDHNIQDGGISDHYGNGASDSESYSVGGMSYGDKSGISGHYKTLGDDNMSEYSGISRHYRSGEWSDDDDRQASFETSKPRKPKFSFPEVTTRWIYNKQDNSRGKPVDYDDQPRRHLHDELKQVYDLESARHSTAPVPQPTPPVGVSSQYPYTHQQQGVRSIPSLSNHHIVPSTGYSANPSMMNTHSTMASTNSSIENSNKALIAALPSGAQSQLKHMMNERQGIVNKMNSILVSGTAATNNNNANIGWNAQQQQQQMVPSMTPSNPYQLDISKPNTVTPPQQQNAQFNPYSTNNVNTPHQAAIFSQDIHNTMQRKMNPAVVSPPEQYKTPASINHTQSMYPDMNSAPTYAGSSYDLREQQRKDEYYGQRSAPPAPHQRGRSTRPRDQFDRSPSRGRSRSMDSRRLFDRDEESPRMMRARSRSVDSRRLYDRDESPPRSMMMRSRSRSVDRRLFDRDDRSPPRSMMMRGRSRSVDRFRFDREGSPSAQYNNRGRSRSVDRFRMERSPPNVRGRSRSVDRHLFEREGSLSRGRSRSVDRRLFDREEQSPPRSMMMRGRSRSVDRFRFDREGSPSAQYNNRGRSRSADRYLGSSSRHREEDMRGRSRSVDRRPIRRDESPPRQERGRSKSVPRTFSGPISQIEIPSRVSSQRSRREREQSPPSQYTRERSRSVPRQAQLRDGSPPHLRSRSRSVPRLREGSTSKAMISSHRSDSPPRRVSTTSRNNGERSPARRGRSRSVPRNITQHNDNSLPLIRSKKKSPSPPPTLPTAQRRSRSRSADTRSVHRRRESQPSSIQERSRARSRSVPRVIESRSMDKKESTSGGRRRRSPSVSRSKRRETSPQSQKQDLQSRPTRGRSRSIPRAIETRSVVSVNSSKRPSQRPARERSRSRPRTVDTRSVVSKSSSSNTKQRQRPTRARSRSVPRAIDTRSVASMSSSKRPSSKRPARERSRSRPRVSTTASVSSRSVSRKEKQSSKRDVDTAVSVSSRDRSVRMSNRKPKHTPPPIREDIGDKHQSELRSQQAVRNNPAPSAASVKSGEVRSTDKSRSSDAKSVGRTTKEKTEETDVERRRRTRRSRSRAPPEEGEQRRRRRSRSRARPEKDETNNESNSHPDVEQQQRRRRRSRSAARSSRKLVDSDVLSMSSSKKGPNNGRQRNDTPGRRRRRSRSVGKGEHQRHHLANNNMDGMSAVKKDLPPQSIKRSLSMKSRSNTDNSNPAHPLMDEVVVIDITDEKTTGGKECQTIGKTLPTDVSFLSSMDGTTEHVPDNLKKILVCSATICFLSVIAVVIIIVIFIYNGEFSKATPPIET